MKTSTRLLALALGSLLTAFTARAELIDVTLEGSVTSLITDVYEPASTDAAGTAPPPWTKVAQRRPEKHGGFVNGGGIRLDFSFDTATNTVQAARLTDSLGKTWHAGHVDPYLLRASNSFWSGSFAVDLQKAPQDDWINVSARLDFDASAYPGAPESRFSAADHFDALTHLSGGAAQVMTSARCTLVESHVGEKACTTIAADLGKVTFATAERSVTAMVPEPATTGLALAGLACAGVTMRRRISKPSPH